MADKHNKQLRRRIFVVILLFLFGTFVILPQLPTFGESLATLRNADFVYIFSSLIWWLTTYFAAALVYVSLSKKPLPLVRTTLVQLAGGFANRFAPSGSGAIATSIRYLVKRGYSTTQASTIVGLNNLLGFVSTVLLLIILVLINGQPLHGYFSLDIHISRVWIIVVLAILAVLGSVLFGNKKVKKISQNIWSTAKGIVREPLRVGGALLAAIAITVGYALCLYSVGLACNVHINAVQVLLVMTLGVAAASVTPTPGGIGGAEAGLTAALIAVGVTSHQAVTVALIYRLITYWLAIIPGFISFQLAIRKKYI